MPALTVAIASALAIALPQFALAQSTPSKTNPSSQAKPSAPSLWWAAKQFGGKLLVSWSAYPARGSTPGQIELVVRREVWRPLTYVERYAFVNRFGTVARDYGYNLRVLDRERNLLATYRCDRPLSSQATCQIRLGSQAR